MRKLLLAVLSGRPLTDLWLIMPDRQFRALASYLKVEEGDMHEWLCNALGCRCS